MLWLWLVIGGFAALVALIGLAGALTPVAHVARRTAVFHRPPAEIWAALTDIAAYPSWRPELTAARALDPENGHYIWEESGKWGKIKMERLEAVERERLVARIASTDQGFGGSWTWELSPEGTGTRLTITENGEVHNIFFRAMARFFFGYTSTMDGYLKQLGKKFGEEIEPADPPAAGAPPA